MPCRLQLINTYHIIIIMKFQRFVVCSSCSPGSGRRFTKLFACLFVIWRWLVQFKIKRQRPTIISEEPNYTSAVCTVATLNPIAIIGVFCVVNYIRDIIVSKTSVTSFHCSYVSCDFVSSELRHCFYKANVIIANNGCPQLYSSLGVGNWSICFRFGLTYFPCSKRNLKLLFKYFVCVKTY